MPDPSQKHPWRRRHGDSLRHGKNMHRTQTKEATRDGNMTTGGRKAIKVDTEAAVHWPEPRTVINATKKGQRTSIKNKKSGKRRKRYSFIGNTTKNWKISRTTHGGQQQGRPGEQEERHKGKYLLDCATYPSLTNTKSLHVQKLTKEMRVTSANSEFKPTHATKVKITVNKR